MTRAQRQSVERRAPAKVNLTLAVLGELAGGYHELESWVVMVDWFDRLALRPASNLSLTVGGSNGHALPRSEDNLVWRAAEALAAAAGREPAASIELEKSLPIGAGLGGGSSDAASTLLGLNELWGLNWPVERLMPIASGLGSDVPLFLEETPAVIRGRGERVERLRSGWKGRLVLATPSFELVTSDVYGRFSRSDVRRREFHKPWQNVGLDGLDLSRRLFNDLEPAAFAVEPRLARLHELLDGLGGRPVRMTGSGSSLFALFDDARAAEVWREEAARLTGPTVEFHVVQTLKSS